MIIVGGARGIVEGLVGEAENALVTYLAALSRMPEPRELDYAQTYLARGMNRAERAQDLLWALLNSKAFLYNY